MHGEVVWVHYFSSAVWLRSELDATMAIWAAYHAHVWRAVRDVHTNNAYRNSVQAKVKHFKYNETTSENELPQRTYSDQIAYDFCGKCNWIEREF